MCMTSPSRPRQLALSYLLPAILSLVAVAACGSAASTGSTSSGSAASTGATPSQAAPAAKVSLTVVVTTSPGAKPKRWTLTCDPVGGTHPHAKAACRQLLAAKNPFAPIPRGIMCPMIPAGPQQTTAKVTGTYFGKPVDGTFSRQSPCAASRWAELGVVFGSTQSVSGESGSPVH
jgi:Subtilisin inhibitor-like